MMIGRILSALSLAALAGGVVYAQSGDDESSGEATPAAQETPVLDSAKVSTKADARAFGEQEFDLADANKDGKVNQPEYVAFVRAQAIARTSDKKDPNAGDAANVNLSEDNTHYIAVAETPTETEAVLGAAPAALFQALSRGEATITKKIIVKARLANFKRADADRDKTLNQAEQEKFDALVWGRETQ